MSGRYDMGRIADTVAEARRHFAADLAALDDLFHRVAALRRRFEVPVVAFLGPGRSGKDTAAYLFAGGGLVHHGSTSRVVAPWIAHVVGRDVVDAWHERHTHRAFWKAWCDEFCKDDPAAIIRPALALGDVVAGVRGLVEQRTARGTYFDLSVWVDREVPADMTVDFGVDDCDVVLPNRGTKDELARRVHALRAAALPAPGRLTNYGALAARERAPWADTRVPQS